MKIIAPLIASILVVFFTNSADALSTKKCNDPFVGTGYGPYDFRKYRRTDNKINIVERIHFTSAYKNRALYNKRAATISSSALGHNLDYTLRALPNNPEALNAMAVFQAREIKNKPRSYWEVRSFMPAECYFRRAIAFAPDDVNVHNIYGIYFQRIGQQQKAMEQFKIVVEMQPNSAKAHYNLGLIFYSLKEFKKSALEAKQAYALGYKKPDLKRRLKSKGFWK